ncbi:MAP3K7 C-terminal-like protein [Stigmatopora nigra]
MITSSQRVSPDSPEVRISFSLGDSSDTQDGDDYSQTFPDLEQRLQPVLPLLSLKDSVHVYKEHCRMAGEFCQVKHDIAALEERKCKLLAELVEDQKASTEISRLEDEFRRLSEENRTLVTKHGERSQQLQRLRRPDSS